MINPISPITPNSIGKASAVSNAAEIIRPGAAAGTHAADFGTVLGKLITETAESLRGAEATAINGITGKAAVQDVVESVLAAEQTLQAAIAIRDKVTATYLELSRMAI